GNRERRSCRRGARDTRARARLAAGGPERAPRRADDPPADRPDPARPRRADPARHVRTPRRAARAPRARRADPAETRTIPCRMTVPPPGFETLRAKLGDVHDLVKTSSLLSWDEETMMPPNGAEVRAYQLATTGRLAHERVISDESGNLLDDRTPYADTRGRESANTTPPPTPRPNS